MNGYISIRRIAEDIMQHPMLRSISFDRIINYVGELIGIIGSPCLYEDKVSTVEINNHRGVLPCDFVKVIQVRGTRCEEFVGNTNNFLEVDKCCSPKIGLPTYKIQGNVIITSIKEGTIEVSYRAMLLDDEGFPMIPDDQTFKRAVEYYIKMRYFEILFDQGQITAQVYSNACTQYNNYIAQAQIHLIMPTEDEMETITNIWCNLIPRVKEHKNGFANLHNREYLRNH